MKSLLSILLLLLFSLDTVSGQSVDEVGRVILVLDAFEQVIVDCDHEAASQLLTEEVHILEGSAIETKDEYLSYHFHSDGNFLSAKDRTKDSRKIFIQENLCECNKSSAFTIPKRPEIKLF